MVASLLIIGFSLGLFLYWFRYSCILLLRNRAAQPALEDTRFHFAQVEQRLDQESELDPLHLALQRDYELLSYLLEHAANLQLRSVEDRLLVLDYRIMQGWYRVTRNAAPARAREALREMAGILGVLVQRMGRQADARFEA